MRTSFTARGIAALLVVAAAATGAHAQEPLGAELVGVWSWTMPSGSCTEIHTYRADGTRHVPSGEERSDSTFKVESFSGAIFTKLTVTTTKDYRGKDCANSDEDDTGRTSILYFVLSRDRQKVLFCYEPSFKSCYGPFARQPGA
jgi:hypothetical protein